MDYGNSLEISCFCEGLLKGNMFLSALNSKHDWVTSLHPNSLLFFVSCGSHFVLQHTASCQDLWGRDHAAVYVDTACVPCEGPLQ